MLDLRCPDSHCERTEGTVGRRVTVTADNRHSGLGQSQLRTDDVNDALFLVAHGVQADTELFTVASQGVDLRARHRVGDGQVCVDRRHVVILGRDRQVRPVDGPAREPQTFECLRTRDLVNEVEIDEDQIGVVATVRVSAYDDVVVPHLLGESTRLTCAVRHHCTHSGCSTCGFGWGAARVGGLCRLSRASHDVDR
ncbi:Uncharacterised protein [Mycobacteroides abscessus subsp. abscessus]|nr:Uncharacterised protein [Mycobacteroides abscessus subsp. abscessus]